jgi:hypothetical protein
MNMGDLWEIYHFHREVLDYMAERKQNREHNQTLKTRTLSEHKRINWRKFFLCDFAEHERSRRKPG